jgi:hypothetical protein
MKGTEKLQLKLNRAALERLLDGDEEMEVLMSHAAVQQILDNHAEVINRAIQKRVNRLFESNNWGLHAAVRSESRDIITQTIKTEVGNYLRCNAPLIRGLIMEQVDAQLPKEIKNAVAARMKTISQRVLKEFDDEE